MVSGICARLGVLTILVSASSQEPNLYVVTGSSKKALTWIGYWSADGIYQAAKQTNTSQTYFTRVNEKEVWSTFLYPVGWKAGQHWVIGRGKDVGRARAGFRSPGEVGGRPPVHGWGWVQDQSREGREEEKVWQNLEVTRILGNITTEQLVSQHGADIEGGYYCQFQRVRKGEQDWKVLKKKQQCIQISDGISARQLSLYWVGDLRNLSYPLNKRK